MSKPWDFLGIGAALTDIKNYREWIKIIKDAEKISNSFYKKYNMGRDSFYNIFVIVTLAPEDSNLPEQILRLRVVEAIAPLNRHLDEDLGFSEYLVPEFSRVLSDDKPTMSFLVVYEFIFQKITFEWIITRFLLLGGLTFAAFKIPWSSLFSWISSLI